MITVAAWLWAAFYISLGFTMCALARSALFYARRDSVPSDNFEFPAITLIKPVKGVSPFTKINFRSWLSQEYPTKIEFIFSFQDPEDRSIPIVRELMDELPSHNIKILINPIRDGFSGKTSNLFYGVEAASHEFLILSDADMMAKPFTIQDIVLRAEGNKSVVSCLPIHHSAVGLWSHLYMTLWNAVIVGLWAPTVVRFSPPGLSGGTVGFYKSDLEKIGGVERFASYIAEDIKKGVLFKDAGYRIELGPVIESKVGTLTRRQCWNAFMRGAYVSWNNEHGGLLRAIPLNILVYGYVVLLPFAVISDHPTALPFFLIYVSRILAHSYFNWLAGNKWNFAFDTYLGDAMICAAFVYSFIKRELEWAGVKYRVLTDGRFEKI